MALGPIPAGHVRGLLECAVCLEQYRSPKELDCQHSFCESPCLEQLLSPITRTIQCPMCRATQAVPGGDVSRLRSNRTIQQFIDASLLKTSTTSNSICEICGSAGLTTICIHCKSEVCVMCKEKHTSYMLADVSSLLASTTEETNSLLDTIPENSHPIEELRLEIDQLRTKMADAVDNAERVLDMAVDRDQKRVALQNLFGFCTDTRNTLECKDTSQGDLESLRKILIDKVKCIKAMSTSCHTEFAIESSLSHIKDLCLGRESHKAAAETVSTGTMTTTPDQISDERDDYTENDQLSDERNDYTENDQLSDERDYYTENDQVSDERDDSIESYKKIRHPIKTLHGSPSGEFVELFSAVISPFNGDIAISDRGKHTVTLLDKEGNFKRDLSCFGSEPGEFYEPLGMDYTSNGDLLVADSQNHRIQIFDADGDFIRTFSRHGSNTFQLNTPTDICYCAYENCYYVCDYGNDRIQRFNINGSGIYKTELVLKNFVGPFRIKYDSACNHIGVHHDGGFSYYTGNDDYSHVEASFMNDLAKSGSVAFSTDHIYTFVVKSCRNGMIYIYNDNSGRVVYKFPSAEAICSQKPIIDLAVRNGRVVVVGSDFIEIY